MCLLFVLVEPAQVQFHLAFVAVLELTQFKFDGYQPVEFAVEKEQVEIVIGCVNRNALLASQKSKIVAQFKYKLLQVVHD